MTVHVITDVLENGILEEKSRCLACGSLGTNSNGTLYRSKYQIELDEKTGSLTPPTERVHDVRYLGFPVYDCSSTY